MSDLAPGCTPYFDDLPELALGILTGRERADALAHVETCPICADELERLSRAADALLEAAPGVEPPLGFEVRVLDRLGVTPARRRPRSRRAAITWGGAALATIAAFAMGFLLAPKTPVEPPGSYSADGRGDPPMAPSRPRTLGEAVAYAGQPAWLTMSVHGLKPDEEITCSVRTLSGTTREIGKFWLAAGSRASGPAGFLSLLENLR